MFLLFIFVTEMIPSEHNECLAFVWCFELFKALDHLLSLYVLFFVISQWGGGISCCYSHSEMQSRSRARWGDILKVVQVISGEYAVKIPFFWFLVSVVFLCLSLPSHNRVPRPQNLDSTLRPSGTAVTIPEPTPLLLYCWVISSFIIPLWHLQWL